MCKDVSGTAADFRADDYATMSVSHFTMSDDDILRGHGTFSAVMIAPTLDGYTVVAGIEETVFYEYTVT